MRDPEVQALLDKQAIYEVLMKYCRGIDRIDEELLRSVYHPDAWDDHGSFKGPASEYVTYIVASLRAGADAGCNNFHSVSNVLIELDGDVAHTETYITSWHPALKDGKNNNWIFAGRYVDRFERRNGAWKIAHRMTVCDWEYVAPPAETKMFEQNPFTRGHRSREDAVYRR